jgi:predicted membrane chloride channel (bestrophin family)
LSSAIDVGNISVSIPLGKNRLVQNPIPIIWVIIIVRLVWIICFFAEIVAGTEQEEVAFPSWIISVKNVVSKE